MFRRMTIAALLLTIASWTAPAMNARMHSGWAFAKSQSKTETKNKATESSRGVTTNLWNSSSSEAWEHDPQGVDEWATRALASPQSDRGWSQSCSKDWKDDRVSSCAVRELSYALDKNPIAIDGGHNGGMTVVGWDRNQVRVLYRVVARAHSEARAQELAESVHINRARSKLVPDGPEANDSEWWSTEVRIWVPRSSDLSLRTMNGPIGVNDVQGTMEIDAVNGPVSLVDLGGAVEARIQNGPLDVALEGSRWNGAGLDAATTNGPVNFVLPANYSARVETGTISGPSSIDYAVELRNHRSGYITATLGSGGPPVRVVTTNGPFHMAAH